MHNQYNAITKKIVAKIYELLNTKELQIVTLCIFNLLYMHYAIFSSEAMEFELDPHSFFDNFWGVLFDIFVLISLFYLLTLGRIRTCLILTFFATLIWSFCNLLYFRFFLHYLSLDAIGQAGAMREGFMLKATIHKLSWSDLLYIIEIIIFIKINKDTQKTQIHHLISKYALLLLILLIFCFGIRFSQFTNCIRFYLPTLAKLYYSSSLYVCAPNSTTFRRGCTRILAIEFINKMSKPIELSPEQTKMIKDATAHSKETMSKLGKNKGKNMIFILIESYMSFTSDFIVEGQEVTPNLNKLRHDKNVYFNGHMTPNISIGESSDGQFIYMTGILPLKTSLTISSIKESILPGLPRQTSKLYKESRMIIPTSPHIWNQQEMSNLYGFNKLYSSYDYNDGSISTLNDFEVFELAKQIDRKSPKPFFSIVLTMSMHYPYKKEIDSTFAIKTESLPQELRYYLNACHYTDRTIGSYLAHLKEIGLYDNTIIIITSDHHVHTANFGEYKSNEIPVYIINGDVNSTSGWQGPCNQLDLYTTLLDMLDIDSKWSGLGHSLYSKSYQNSVCDDKWEISEWIIRSNYFGTNN
jgi:lipoteichoic acid synthase